VLIVDDEEANRIVVRRVLEDAGWTTIEACDGNQAVDLAIEKRPALIVMDIDMPGCDGFAATQAIRRSDRPLSSVPVLVYSAMQLSDDEISRRGMDGRIPKPFKPEQLIEAIAPWLQDGQMAGAERLAGVFGKAELDKLIAGLREQLMTAVEDLDTVPIPATAHRIAGLAGTLGFAALSASWLALSEGDESARDGARRDARLAIAAIDRSGEVTPDH
jgi:CheY-like chemotaxis protein